MSRCHRLRARCAPLAALTAWLLGALIAALPRYGVADELYKTVDPEGHVTYSDRPLSPSSQRMSVQVTAPNPNEAARLTKEQAALSAADAARVKQEQQAAEEQKNKAAQQAAQQQRCDAARSRYATFAAGGRLFKADADGNRVYYSDEEIAQQRDAAKVAMDSACNF